MRTKRVFIITCLLISSLSTCYSQVVKDIEGNIYKTVKIGSQEWMTENLRTTKYNDGESIPLIVDNSVWGKGENAGYCWYHNDVTFKKEYGALYNWYSVNSNKLCPLGWHVPDDEDWTALTDFLGGEMNAGDMLKADSGIWDESGQGTNETGFTALPGGKRDGDGEFAVFGEFGYWWSATEFDVDNSWERSMRYSDSDVFRTIFNKRYGISVRCLKD
jgi:uncharacterized protein (TIGR02145 family)